MVDIIAVPDKSQAARTLADWNRSIDPAITRIFRIVSEREADEREILKMLYVNPETSPSGIVPLVFSADPPSIPFPFVRIDVTEEEFEDLQAGRLVLPDNWKLGEAIY